VVGLFKIFPIGGGYCVISFTQRDVSVCQNINTTKTTTICTDYTSRKEARALSPTQRGLKHLRIICNIYLFVVTLLM